MLCVITDFLLYNQLAVTLAMPQPGGTDAAGKVPIGDGQAPVADVKAPVADGIAPGADKDKKTDGTETTHKPHTGTGGHAHHHHHREPRSADPAFGMAGASFVPALSALFGKIFG